jgi:ribonuclease III
MSRVVRIKDLDLGELEQTLGVKFTNIAHLEKALTHLSAIKGEKARLESYQRLEFLGDRVLGVCITAMLYKQFPLSEEGDLSRRMAELVRAESCYEVARLWDIGKFMRLGRGEAQSGSRKNYSILADMCEAVIGAIYLDQGHDAVFGTIERAWHERMLNPHRPLRDAKTVLQEWAQGKGLPSPIYREDSRSGSDHHPKFEVSAIVQGVVPEQAQGKSKRIAEQAAAEALLRREGIWTEEQCKNIFA